MSLDTLNPVNVESRIRDISARIANSASVCNTRYETFLDADRNYDQAFARAYMGHDGPAHEKKYAAELATGQEREARDIADASYRYADRLAKALESELRAYQSIGASVRAMYGVAGRGEGL
ncbi:hypothetical protein NMP99_02900 [Glutamicibacter mishrai]|uniref:hypothetical protein n=1 Tax=Glutamicibacter mishrai TaxID=1775880 RepID=UPI0020CC5897|nr:hypothetical protein [Glutamicibacter mishrai]UTT40224.1 hypothetical protein NMP99_02610 [Glutamicibacter mishrai]UTT40275.1 hypothetical protein NMP99_02900 [Glutamicibacter mishrai]